MRAILALLTTCLLCWLPAEEAAPPTMDQVMQEITTLFRTGKPTAESVKPALTKLDMIYAAAKNPWAMPDLQAPLVKIQVLVAVGAVDEGIAVLNDLRGKAPKDNKDLQGQLGAFHVQALQQGGRPAEALTVASGLWESVKGGGGKEKFGAAAMVGQLLSDTGDIDGLEALKKELMGMGAPAELVTQFDGMIASAKLGPGFAFPPFAVKDLEGKDLKLEDYKGKVVLIDFWATWCGPCVAELPHVKAAYAKYKDQGFEIIGISFDKDRAKLDTFIAEHGMTWAQYFDGKGWSNDLGKQYGIRSIPATYLLDRQGMIVAKDLRGDALGEAVKVALGAK